MSYKQRRKVDLFSLLVAVVAAGMSLTILYQLSLDYLKARAPVAERHFDASAIDG